MGTTRLAPGDLLVAVPQLTDPHFRRSVVLLLHRDDEGSVGVTLNRKLDVSVGSVLPAWQAVADEPASVFQGGPVGLEVAIAVATLRAGVEPPPAVTRIAGAFGLVDLDTAPEDVRGVLGLRVFAGHAGWAGGQLESEVAAGDWYVFPALPSDVVTGDPADLWRAVLRRQGGSLAIVSTFPEDPSLN